jgi:hypothetical protein
MKNNDVAQNKVEIFCFCCHRELVKQMTKGQKYCFKFIVHYTRSVT